jgi:putative ABC transport system substrate-binding protein
MSKEILGFLLTITFLATGPLAEAQQTKVTKIGWLGARSASAPARDLFGRELRALGYVEGKNIAFEYRYAEGRLDRLPALADELIRLKVDVLLTPATPAAVAAKNATRRSQSFFTPDLILLRLGWLTASRGQGETSPGSLQ